jgi:hypothetical protein
LNEYEFLFEWNRDTIGLLCLWLRLSPPPETRNSEPVPSLPESGSRPESVKFSRYPQVFEHRHGFLENLSCLDLIASEGPAAYSVLIGR